jgi:hypothetical protein
MVAYFPGHWFADGLSGVMAEGDITRGGFIDMLGNLLDRGVQVVLMYGDRDYIGNCKIPGRSLGW